MIQPQKGNQRERIMFEVTKADVSMILDKLSVLNTMAKAIPEGQ